MSNRVLSEGIVYGVRRCPHCSIAKPLMTLTQIPAFHHESKYEYYFYFTASCSHCGHYTLFHAASSENDPKRDMEVKRQFPDLTEVDEELPERAKKFLKQAFESKHAPDGALMLAAASIDAMLKDKGFKTGSLYERIELAAKANLLTCEMRDWAHEIRLSANEPRHADDDFDGATVQDIEQILEFSSALGQYLYSLPARVRKWKNNDS